MHLTWEEITETQSLVTTTSFAQVIRQARRHDEEAVVALYQRALPVIYRYAFARLGRPDLVEDVVSEVFLVMVESIDELRTEQEAGFYAWLLQIAQGKISRTIRTISRNERKHVPLPGVHKAETPGSMELIATDMVSNPVELHEWRETLEEVGVAMGNLSAEQQVVVVGRFLAGQKIEDLAQALGKQPGTVRILQFRALNTLAKHLGMARGSHRMRKGERG